MANPNVISLQRLRRVDYQRRDYLEVTDTAEAAEWVRSLGHEAASVEPDGFRYRSVYTDGEKSPWHWVEVGQWLSHLSGDRQQPELDLASDAGPEDANSWRFNLGQDGEWIPVPASPNKGND